MRAITITPETITLGETDTSLSGLQAAVGGCIEAISVTQDDERGAWVGWGNDEAKLIGLSRNQLATDLLKRLGWVGMPGDYIAGTLVITGADDEGDIARVPQWVAQEAMQLVVGL